MLSSVLYCKIKQFENVLYYRLSRHKQDALQCKVGQVIRNNDFKTLRGF